MVKNIIIIVLAILLVISGSIGIYLFQNNINIEKNAQDKIKNLENSKKDLEQKIGKSLVYIQTLDLIMEPSRQQIGLEKKELNQSEWLRNLSDTINKTGDIKLQNIFKKITTGEPEEVTNATIEFIDYALKEILNYFKTE